MDMGQPLTPALSPSEGAREKRRRVLVTWLVSWQIQRLGAAFKGRFWLEILILARYCWELMMVMPLPANVRVGCFETCHVQPATGNFSAVNESA